MTTRLKIPIASRAATALSSLSLITVLGVSLSGQQVENPPQPQVAGLTTQDRGADEGRFAVALQHSSSWCYGYLYVSRDRVRFQVAQPQSDNRYSFEAPRTEVTARQWVILGLPQDVLELKAKGVTYHLRWLADEGEVKTGGARRWSPPASRPPNALIAAVQNFDATAQSSKQSADKFGDKTSQGPPSPSLTALHEAPQNVPPGMLAGVYVATAGEDARPANKQYLFYPDGYVMNGVPQEGMLNFDFNHLRNADNPDKFWVGRYKVAEEEIKIVWLNQYADPANPDVILHNETSAHPPARMGWQVFIPMCRCTGKRLSGTYRWGAPAADQYIQFFPDGTFIDHRVTDQMLVPNRFYEHPRIQRGTYDIQRQTIIFTFTDGHRGTRTFLAPRAQENNPTFDWIDLGWHMLFEEGYRVKLSQGW